MMSDLTHEDIVMARLDSALERVSIQLRKIAEIFDSGLTALLIIEPFGLSSEQLEQRDLCGVCLRTRSDVMSANAQTYADNLPILVKLPILLCTECAKVVLQKEIKL